MKKIIKIFNKLYDEGVLALVGLGITFGWISYLFKVVEAFEGGILGKILFGVWFLVLAFRFILYYTNRSEE